MSDSVMADNVVDAGSALDPNFAHQVEQAVVVLHTDIEEGADVVTADEAPLENDGILPLSPDLWGTGYVLPVTLHDKDGSESRKNDISKTGG